MRLDATLANAARRNAASRPAMPHHGIPVWIDSGMIAEAAPGHMFAADAQMIAVQRSSMFKIAMAHCRHITVAMHVVISADAEAGSDDDADVEGREISGGDSEWRHVDFTEAQREPADHRFGHNHADRKVSEGHQRRSKHRTNHDGARNPAPRAVDHDPASKMKGSPTPRSVVNPGPAIRLEPAEMPEAVGRPSGHQARGEPDIAVRRVDAPAAKPVQIRISGNVARNITRRDNGFLATIAIHAERIETIRRSQRVRSFQNRIRLRAGRPRHHPQVNGRGLVAHVDFGVARAHRGDGGVAGLGDIDAIIAIPQQGEGKLRRVDLEPFVRSQGVQPDIESPGGDLNLGHRVAQVQKRKIGAPGQANRRIVGLQFHQTIGLGPDVIAQHDRMIQFGGGPIFDAGGLKRNSSGKITKARDPAGRRVVLRERRKG